MTRADIQRIDDMLQATSEIADIVSRGRGAYDHDIALRRGAPFYTLERQAAVRDGGVEEQRRVQHLRAP